VVQVGPDVSRFSVGDRITTNSAQALRNDARFGAYQRYALTKAALTAHIGDYPFDLAATAASIYAPACALCYHLGLDRPAKHPDPSNKNKTVLIWGASSTFGSMAVQIAAGGGYTVLGVASAHNESLVRSFGAAHFVDRHSATIMDTLSLLGPFQAVLMAQDSKADQMLIARVLDAQGGGEFLSTMGVRNGVQLPKGVKGSFKQFLDEYLKPENQEFTEWLWWDYLENMLKGQTLDLLPVKVLGGLDKVQVAWGILERGEVSATKLVIHPQDNLDLALE
jgi:NADPH:quinone reductase-like Zn-dependent oxidoreductase